MQDLISVIVPVYNVEEYLERCINSITCQSYSNLEIILVDDGSTDNSPALCDKLASQDSRIIVIHKTNGGLSSARNAGIDIAKGEYLVFVDSDDWLHPDYIKMFYGEAHCSNNLMVMGNFKRCTEIIPPPVLCGTFQHISKDEAIPRMLKGEWISAWAKLYHRSLFNNVRFPVGRNNEDYAILIYLFEQCEKVSYTKDVVYYYYMREGSITHSALNSHSFDEYINGIEVYNYCKQKYPQWAGLALFNLTASIIKLTDQCITDTMYMEKYDVLKIYAIAHKKEILNNPSLSLQYKPFICSLMMGKYAHKTWLRIYKHFRR